VDWLCSIIWRREDLYNDLAKRTAELLARKKAQNRYTETLALDIIEHKIINGVLRRCRTNSDLKDYAIPEVLTHVNTITKKTASKLLLRQLQPEIEDALAEIEQMKHFGSSGGGDDKQ
jgi:hypothetical protein